MLVAAALALVGTGALGKPTQAPPIPQPGDWAAKLPEDKRAYVQFTVAKAGAKGRQMPTAQFGVPADCDELGYDGWHEGFNAAIPIRIGKTATKFSGREDDEYDIGGEFGSVHFAIHILMKGEFTSKTKAHGTVEGTLDSPQTAGHCETQPMEWTAKFLPEGFQRR